MNATNRGQILLRLCYNSVSVVRRRRILPAIPDTIDRALAVIYTILDRVLTPFSQHFSMNNITLQHPIADPERVPISMAMVYSCFCPAVIIAIYTLVLDGMFSKSKGNVPRMRRYTWGDRLWELNCGLLGLFLAQGSAFVITGSLKNLIGKPRPDLLARCQLYPNVTADPGPPNYGLLSRDDCSQGDYHILQDGEWKLLKKAPHDFATSD